MRKIFLLLIILSAFQSFSQADSAMGKKIRKFTFYGTWGYNRWAFTKSSIHFVNDGTPNDPDPTHQPYDFTMYNVTAHDAADFDHIAGNLEDVVNVTIPQFSVRAGFYFNNKKDEGWEINYDHAKYVVTDEQKMHVKGTINGHSFDTLAAYPRSYFHFEHTDGANFWQLNYIKRWKFYTSKNGKSSIGWMFKPGAGIVVPRTDVTLFGNRLNNRWHIAGFIAGLETGFRAEFLNHLCLEFTAKAAYADYLWCYVQYKDHGNASHRFGTVGAILSLGYQFYHFAPAKKS